MALLPVNGLMEHSDGLSLLFSTPPNPYPHSQALQKSARRRRRGEPGISRVHIRFWVNRNLSMHPPSPKRHHS